MNFTSFAVWQVTAIDEFKGFISDMISIFIIFS